jgi:hypothetical protein
MNYLPWLVSNLHPPDLCLLSSSNYIHESPALAISFIFVSMNLYLHLCVYIHVKETERESVQKVGSHA